MLSSKLYTSSKEYAASVYKKSKSKERVTSNVNNDLKLKLLVIGMSAKSRALKKSLYLHCVVMLYKNQNSAWMDKTICNKCFFTRFCSRYEKIPADKGLAFQSNINS